jgi:hypothetical protein
MNDYKVFLGPKFIGAFIAESEHHAIELAKTKHYLLNTGKNISLWRARKVVYANKLQYGKSA